MKIRVALVVDLAWAWATHFSFQAGAVRVLRAPEAGAVRRMRGGAAPDHHGHSPRVEVELLALTDCAAGCVK